jgi:hypothetical protein
VQDNEDVFKPQNFPYFVLFDAVSILNKLTLSHSLAVLLLVAAVCPETDFDAPTTL